MSTQVASRIRWLSWTSRHALELLLVAAALLSVVQIWIHWDWLGDANGECDFPDDCLLRFYPHAYQVVRILWALSVLLGLVILTVAALERAPRPALLKISGGAALTFCAYFFTPVYEGRNANGLLSGGQPTTLDREYAIAFVLLIAAALLYASARREVGASRKAE